MKKIGAMGIFLLIITFLFKHGIYIVKIIISFLAGEAVSAVVIDPLLKKHVVDSVRENNDATKYDNYLELITLRAILDSEKKDISEQDRQRGVSRLRDLAKNHTGIFIAACKEYFEKEEEMQEFLRKNSIEISFE